MSRLFMWVISGKEIIVPTFGSYGDMLMTNGVLKQYAATKKSGKLYLVCKNDYLVYNLPFIRAYLHRSSSYYMSLRLSKYFKRIKVINYGTINEDKQAHLMERIAKRLQFKLSKPFFPYMVHDKKDEVDLDFIKGKFVCIQSSANTIFSANKNWDMGELDKVVDHLNLGCTTIQVGVKDDLPLNTQYHLNGKLSFRQSCYLLSKATLFVGPEGALMHAASASNTKSVIIFGGYIHHRNSGYQNVIPVESHITCAPCLIPSSCTIGLLCMKELKAETVIEKINEVSDDI